MIQSDVLLDPGLSGMPSLSNVDLTMFAGDAVNTSCFEAKVILDRPKETDDLPRWRPTVLMVMSHQHPTDAVEDWSSK